MAIIDLVKWDGNPELLAWKFPSKELSTRTQLIVNETQEAFVVRGGVYDGPFEAGRHTLETQNLPLLRGVIGLPYGEETPFAAEVWFVNRIINLDIRWGTLEPIQVLDPTYHVMLPVRATAQYGIQIIDSKKFLLKIVGTLPVFDVNHLKEYLNGILTMRIKRTIASAIVDQKVSVLEASMYLDEFSAKLQAVLEPILEEYGLRISQLSIVSINVPESDTAVVQLKAALAKAAEYNIFGTSYQQERSFNVLESAASNEGNSGSVMGAGLGLGLGAGIGGPIGNSMSQLTSALSTNGESKNDMATALKLIEDAQKKLESGSITPDEFSLIKKNLLG